MIISSPITGNAVELSEVPDEGFAGKMMGDGAAVIPTDGMILAPEDGEVVFVFETKHALGFQTDSQMALLLHIGIDTVALNGQGFEVFVENGQKVKKWGAVDENRYFLSERTCTVSLFTGSVYRIRRQSEGSSFERRRDKGGRTIVCRGCL